MAFPQVLAKDERFLNEKWDETFVFLINLDQPFFLPFAIWLGEWAKLHIENISGTTFFTKWFP